MSQWSRLPLDAEHIKMLKDSGIAYAVAKARGYRTIHKTIEAETLGFKRYQAPASRMPGLLVPMFMPGTDKTPSGHQIKMSEPRKVRGRDLKYETPAGLPNILDLNPIVKDEARNNARRLWIVEGIKKADSLISSGEVAVGIAGVWAWRGTNSSGGKTALAAFDDLALNEREVFVCFDSDALDKAQVANAMDRLVHYLRARGADAKFVIVPAATGTDKVGADDFLLAGGTVDELVACAVDELPEDDSTSRVRVGYERVTAELQGFRFVLDWGKWLRWDGRRWGMDTSKNHLVTGAILDIIDPDKLWITGRENSLNEADAIRRAMEADEAGFHVTSDMLDARPNLLNCANGIVDLRTGVLSPHDPEQLLTKITRGAYRPGVRSVDIDTLTQGTVPDDCRVYLKRVFGYAVFGTVSEEIMPVLGGRGANGKTTLLTALGAGLGEYADAANTKLIIGSGSEHATIEADLFGMRLVYLSETGEGGVLAIDRVKALTGGDRRKARRMREDYWSFTPSHTLILATNYPPVVEANDYGTWRRLKLIPFPYRFVGTPVNENDRKGDPHLRHRVQTNQAAWDAAVTYCVEGAQDWYNNGFGDTPVSVLEATGTWRESCDTFGAFLREMCVVEPDARIEQAKLSQAYNEWGRELGHAKASTSWIKGQLENLAEEYGFKVSYSRSAGVRFVDGVRQVADGEKPRILTVPHDTKKSDGWFEEFCKQFDEVEPDVAEWLRARNGGDS